jgi:hypothetical protein
VFHLGELIFHFGELGRLIFHLGGLIFHFGGLGGLIFHLGGLIFHLSGINISFGRTHFSFGWI